MARATGLASLETTPNYCVCSPLCQTPWYFRRSIFSNSLKAGFTCKKTFTTPAREPDSFVWRNLFIMIPHSNHILHGSSAHPGSGKSFSNFNGDLPHAVRLFSCIKRKSPAESVGMFSNSIYENFASLLYFYVITALFDFYPSNGCFTTLNPISPQSSCLQRVMSSPHEENMRYLNIPKLMVRFTSMKPLSLLRI